MGFMKAPWLWKTLGGVVLVGLLSGCSPSLQSDDPQVRIRALQAVTDQNVFLQTALTDSDKGVQMEAVKHLTDQSALGQYLERTSSSDAPPGALSLALGKLTDTDELFKLATGNYGCATDAADRFSDRATLIKIASTGLSNDAEMVAIKKLANDSDALYHIALQGSPWTAQQVINMISDQAVLTQIAQAPAPPAGSTMDQYDFSQARSMAVAKLTDSTLLTNLALNDKDSLVRQAAIGQLTDIPTLIKIGQNDPDLNVENSAFRQIGKLGDKNAVPQLLALLPDWDSNVNITLALSALGWTPSSEAEQVYKWISDRDSKDLLAQWDETSRVLFADVQTGDPRKTTNALNTIICVGKTDAVPQLVQILNGSTDVHIAENFMNSGNDDLKNAAQAWGKANGYEFVKKPVDPNDGKRAVNWGKW
jgi:hypothetical protein